MILLTKKNDVVVSYYFGFASEDIVKEKAVSRYDKLAQKKQTYLRFSLREAFCGCIMNLTGKSFRGSADDDTA